MHSYTTTNVINLKLVWKYLVIKVLLIWIRLLQIILIRPDTDQGSSQKIVPHMEIIIIMRKNPQHM